MEMPFERPGSDIKKEGYLKKIKTMKRKYFVLRSTSSSGPARLEYYDNEKKFRNGAQPKRSIALHECFNINQKSDSKHKYAITLYTIDDSFSVMADAEAERNEWLSLLLRYQNEYKPNGEEVQREHYEYVWQVNIQSKGLGGSKGIKGPFRLCLSTHNMSPHSLALFRIGQDKPLFLFQLATVRSVAHNDCIFKLDVGSWAPTGEGEVWMQVDDSVVAQNMHEAILQCMKSPQCDILDEGEARRTERFGSCSINPGSSRELRPRTFSESHTNSPMRLRQQDQGRPMSYTIRSTSLPATDMPSPGTSPHSHLLVDPFFDRTRSDSVGSRSSRVSYSIGTDDHFEPFQPPLSIEGHSSIDEEDMRDYSIMNRDTASNLSSPGELTDGGARGSVYVDMAPGSSSTSTTSATHTAPAPSTSTGYVDMTLSQRQDSADHGNLSPIAAPDPYMMMRPSSSPIPIHAPMPGYMDMSHSTHSAHSSHGSHLPTVQEGGSSDGYLPMTPSCSQSPRSNSFNLRPERAVCMLSEDTGEFHQRTLSLGSRPLAKVRMFNTSEGPKKAGGQLDTSRSCSAPHLMATKPRTLVVDSPTPSASPLSASLKSDDMPSFALMDFNANRSRTGSESYPSRPRASSFGARANPAAHRPRSSSHGQQKMFHFKMKLNAFKASSQEYIHKNSSQDSLRMSSNESLRQNEARHRMLVADYIDMTGDKRKTPSPLPPGQLPGAGGPTDPNGYMDMTLGSSRSNSPHHSRYPHSQASSIGSTERIDAQGYTSMELPRPSSSSSSGSTYMSAEAGDQGGKGSGKHSRSSSAENVDSYVMYEPSTASNSSSKGAAESSAHYSAGHPTGSAHAGTAGQPQTQHGSMGHASGGYTSPQSAAWPGGYNIGPFLSGMREDGHHRTSQESVTSRSSGNRHSPKRRGSRDSGKSEQATVRVVQIPPTDASRERRRTPPGQPAPKGETDEYIEFSPLTTKSASSDSGSVGSSGSEHQQTTTVVQPESQYVDFQPGQVGPIAPPASSVGMMSSGGGAFVVPPSSASRSASSSAQDGEAARAKRSKDRHKKDKQKGESSTGAAAKPSEEKKPGAASGGDYFNLSFGQKAEGAAKGEGAKAPAKKTPFSMVFSPEDLSRPLESMYRKQASSDIYYQRYPAKRTRPQSQPQAQPQPQSQPKPSTPPQPQPQPQPPPQIQAQPQARPEPASQAQSRKSPSSQGTAAIVVTDTSVRTPRSQAAPSPREKSAPMDTEEQCRRAQKKVPLAYGKMPQGEEAAKDESGVRSSSPRVDASSSSPSPSPQPVFSSSPIPSPIPTASQGNAAAVQDTGSAESTGSGGRSSSVVPKPGLPSFAQKLGKALGGGGSKSGGEGRGERSGTLAHPDSMPCMLGMDRPSGQTLTVDSTPRSRHSIADSSGYEQMSFPNTASLAAKASSSSQPVTPLPSSPCNQKTLNYADLDLGSAESVGDGDGVRTPRGKSRHASAAEERPGASSYAEIDFEKSETLKNANNKDVKFTL